MPTRLMPDAPAPQDALDRDLELLAEHVAWSKLVGDDSEITDALERVMRTMLERSDAPSALQQYLLARLRDA